jgi:hypothetical protein
MADTTFAIIPVPGKPPADAVAHRPISAVMEYVLDSKARVEAEALVKRAEQAAEQEREITSFRACIAGSIV